MSQFIFEAYDFNPDSKQATFSYRFDDGRRFVESATFEAAEHYNNDALQRALFLAHLVIGTSYFKTFPTPHVAIDSGMIDEWVAGFLSRIYQDGLSQFAFENNLTRSDLAQFSSTGQMPAGVSYQAEGKLVLQSGGKDSLLTASLLNTQGTVFTPWYVASGDHHPAVLDDLGQPLAITRRTIDREALQAAVEAGAKNGHVPVTYIVESLALIQAVLLNKNEILVSIAHEGEEPHAMIDDLPVTHQWSKTWEAEQLFAEYVGRYISSDIHIGSPLRRFSELRVAELFIEHAWGTYGHRFSSCNRANYKQGDDNSELHWCGECPKCANSYLLFAPFLNADELKELFAGQDLFEKPMLQETFKGLLNIDGVMKPFECVGEIDELRYAYGLTRKKGGYGTLSFDVPSAEFDYMHEYPAQEWARL
ncbi:MAG: hypothetical protein WAO28_04075 [Candidatus Microsaccharimonas sp.]